MTSRLLKSQSIHFLLLEVLGAGVDGSQVTEERCPGPTAIPPGPHRTQGTWPTLWTYSTDPCLKNQGPGQDPSCTTGQSARASQATLRCPDGTALPRRRSDFILSCPAQRADVWELGGRALTEQRGQLRFFQWKQSPGAEGTRSRPCSEPFLLTKLWPAAHTCVPAFSPPVRAPDLGSAGEGGQPRGALGCWNWSKAQDRNGAKETAPSAGA